LRVSVIGTGHVGLVTSAALARLGHDVCGLDSDPEKIETLRAGRMPFYEPGLADLVHEGTSAGRLSFTCDSPVSLGGSEIVFICVGTPPRSGGEANLAAVEQSARDVARNVTGPTIVVEKSTVPAGTAARVRRTIELERPELADVIEIASNPEFLREGRAVEDSLSPDRILVGADSETAFARLRDLYRPLTDRGIPLIETSIETAELAKHACNAFLALKISYANALARLCELAGADVEDVVRVMGTDERIGPAFLNAGLGYGGFCLPKDIPAFSSLSAKLGYDFALLGEIERINHEAIDAVMTKVSETLWNIESKRIALLGLSFKPETDDVRFSPALTLARRLLDEGADVVGFDPQAGSRAKDEVPDLRIADDLYGAVRDAHCAIVCTDWAEIRSIDLDRLHSVMQHPIVIDGRNVFDPAEMSRRGFTYLATGRPAVN
jgi:UDPglucose 6-dehydrogenase